MLPNKGQSADIVRTNTFEISIWTVANRELTLLENLKLYLNYSWTHIRIFSSIPSYNCKHAWITVAHMGTNLWSLNEEQKIKFRLLKRLLFDALGMPIPKEEKREKILACILQILHSIRREWSNPTISWILLPDFSSLHQTAASDFYL